MVFSNGGALLYLFAPTITVYTLIIFVLLYCARENPYYYALIIFIVFYSFYFFVWSGVLVDGFNRLGIWLLFQVCPLCALLLFYLIKWFLDWLDSDPIVAGVNIRKSIDRKQ